nr:MULTISPECIES: hypothetical protein [unclassified Pseudomonas]
MIMLVGREHLTFDGADVPLLKMRLIFPGVIFRLLRVLPLDSHVSAGLFCDFCQPLLRLGFSQQVLPTDGAMGRAQVDVLHEVITLVATVDHSRALVGRPLQFAVGHVQGGRALEQQRMLGKHAVALILAGLAALPHNLCHLPLKHPVFVQIATGVVDDIQPTVTQLANTQRPRNQSIRHRQRAGRVEPLDPAIP